MLGRGRKPVFARSWSWILFLALSAGVPARQQPPDARPLPDINQLLTEVQKNQKRVEDLTDKYACTETTEEHELDKTGAVKKTRLFRYDVFYLGGEPVRRLVAKDGKPLSESDSQKEDERVEKRIKAYQKEQQEDPTRAKRKKDQVDVSTFLRIANFFDPRREDFRGHETIVFDFVPNPAYKPRNRTEDLLHKLDGTLWVDEQAHQVVRLEAHLGDSLKIAGGLFASLRKGSSLVFEQERINGELWLPSYAEAHFSARLLLFKSLAGDYNSHFSDYKKFRVESVAKPVKGDP
jgi:hypothetical protein